jgi:LPS export ABC transporter protein LptC
VRVAVAALSLAALPLAALAAALPAVAAEPIRIRGMTFVAGAASGQRLVVRAERAEIEPDTEIARLSGVTVRFQSAGAENALALRCAAGRVTLAGQSFRLEGEVTGHDESGRRFTTDWLEFDGDARRLHTTAPVSVEDGAVTYQGVGLEYRVDERELRLLGGVRVESGPEQ